MQPRSQPPTPRLRAQTYGGPGVRPSYPLPLVPLLLHPAPQLAPPPVPMDQSVPQNTPGLPGGPPAQAVSSACELKPETAAEVARQLHEHDALGAHARDELGINEITSANPLEAAGASALSFLVGGGLPFLLIFLFPLEQLFWIEYLFSVSFLALLGGASAALGGSSVKKAVLRITIWSTLIMALSNFIGSFIQMPI